MKNIKFKNYVSHKSPIDYVISLLKFCYESDISENKHHLPLTRENLSMFSETEKDEVLLWLINNK